MIDDIYKVNNLYDSVVLKEYKEKYYDVTKYPIIHGYNFVTSYRNGGKTTNILIWAMCSHKIYGSRISYIRTNKTMTTRSKIMTLFDSINTTVDDTGKNYIQKIYNDKYNKVMYFYNEKCFKLCRDDMTADELKTAEILCYVHSIDTNDDLRSGFADNRLDIILYDECIDNKINNTTLINFLHIVSTFLRTRYKSIIFMACNMSTGAPTILQQMGIYTKVLSQTIPYAMYTTEKHTRISVEILEVSESFSNDRNIMNETFFGFDIDGIEIIRGSSICHESYRELPENTEIIPTNVKLYTCGYWIDVYTTVSDKWQNMIYFKKGIPSTHTSGTITLTDDKNYAFKHPYTYASIGKDFKICLLMAKLFRRSDICCDNYMTYICANSFYDFYKIPELL